MIKSVKSFIDSWAGVFLMMVMIGTVALLGIELHKRPSSNAAALTSTWKAGYKIEELSAETLGGPKKAIDLSAETILYVISPKCGWCTKNLENAQALYRARGARFVALSTTSDGLESYIREHKDQITYPILHKVNDLGIASTPSTVLVEKGVVKQVWAGVWSKENKSSIEKYFGLALPGIKAD